MMEEIWGNHFPGRFHFSHVTLGGTAGESSAAVSTGRQVTIPATEADGAMEVTIDKELEQTRRIPAVVLGDKIPLPALSAEQKGQHGWKFRRSFARCQRQVHPKLLSLTVLAMNKKRRTAWFSAGMIDGTQFKDFQTRHGQVVS